MITIQLKRAQTFWEKSIGLIGTKQAYALCFSTRFGIHTFGLAFPIDVLILDTAHRIVKIKHSLQPNRIFLWSPIWSLVIELPAGAIREKKLHIGDHVKLTYIN